MQSTLVDGIHRTERVLCCIPSQVNCLVYYALGDLAHVVSAPKLSHKHPHVSRVQVQPFPK